VRGGYEVFVAILDEAHWPTQLKREPTCQYVLPAALRFAAKSAADVGRDNANICLAQPKRDAEYRADHVRKLRRRVEGQPTVRECRNTTTSLERRSCLTLAAEPSGHNSSGTCESSGDVVVDAS